MTGHIAGARIFLAGKRKEDSMSIKDQLGADLKNAMRAKDKVRLGAIRMLRAAILEREKSGSGDVSDEEVIAILQKQAKQRRDSIKQYNDADRRDLAETEEAELAVIEDYLPAQLSDDELRRAVAEIVKSTGATGMQDMGKVMGQAMQTLKGKADGRRVKDSVESMLKS